MITMKLSKTDADALVACLGAFLDNEHDKGQEGIGEDLSTECGAILEQINTGALRLSLMHAGLVLRALEIHADGGIDDVWDMPGADAAIAAMVARLSNINITI